MRTSSRSYGSRGEPWEAPAGGYRLPGAGSWSGAWGYWPLLWGTSTVQVLVVEFPLPSVAVTEMV